MGDRGAGDPDGPGRRVVVIIGGLGSVNGSLVGALLVGLTANYISFYAPKMALGSNILLMVLILIAGCAATRQSDEVYCAIADASEIEAAYGMRCAAMMDRMSFLSCGLPRGVVVVTAPSGVADEVATG